jgi:BirA family transcriptional regulator, biotin operon repressor / biotin---[acetyl-CoA-carboxylase] ligase
LPDIFRYADLVSTNDVVAERALAGAADGFWVMADVQTAGRGRRGRVWQSPPGNLYCSTLVRHRDSDPPLQQLSFVAAVALQETLSEYSAHIQLKWPNDLLIQGRKLSGILLEGGGTPASGQWVVIGVGVNVKHFPDDVERPATSLAKQLTGPPPESADVLSRLAVNFDTWCDVWRQQGFAPVRSRWLQFATGIGQTIEVRLGQESLTGMFTGLDADGALLLQLDSGHVRAVHAGEVYGI